MKLATLAKRLAEKSNTPILEQVILGQAELSALPSECMVWTGSSQGNNTLRVMKARDRHKAAFPHVRMDMPRPVIRYQGKKQSVPRLVFLFAVNPDFEFHLQQQCPTPLCINPAHFEVKELDANRQPRKKKQVDIPEFVYVPPEDDEWTDEEVLSSLETYLDQEEAPRGWSDLVKHPLLHGIPHDMLREQLIKLNKEHLT